MRIPLSTPHLGKLFSVLSLVLVCVPAIRDPLPRSTDGAVSDNPPSEASGRVNDFLMEGGGLLVAAAGDIACSPDDPNYRGGEGGASHCRMRATSNLLLGLPLSAVLTLGDLQYNKGGHADFLAAYDPTWGRRSLGGVLQLRPGRVASGGAEFQLRCSGRLS